LKLPLQSKHPHLVHLAKKKQMEEVDPNGMPKNQMPFKGQQKLARGEKPRDKLEGDQVKHLHGWTTNPTKAN
jgi:hypothetical protein